MSHLERDYLRRATHVLAVSEADQNLFARYLDPSRISVIPTGVDVDYFQPAPELEERNTLVFTGSMDWMPNEDGIFFFVEKVLPRIRAEVPEATLWVVGRRPSAKLLKLPNTVPGINVTGTVDDIRPFMGKASVYVVPLLVGGGTRLKIFEAMAMGKAVVSTSIGAEGLPVTNGENGILADQPEEFASQVVSLLRDQPRRLAMGQAARRLVEEKYSWNSVARELISVLREVAQRS